MTTFGETILVVDDDPYIQEALGDRLESLGYRVARASDGKQALELIDHQDPQMVFLDIEMPGMKGLDVLREIRAREKDFPVVMITAYGSVDLAVEAMKEGAYDFIPKPFKANHIALVVEKALERQRLRREKEVLSEEVDKRYRLVAGNSTKLNAAISGAKKAAASKSTILLLGESGTGKELFARAIHNWSERKDRPFIAINCVGLSKELLESELFGYERGAFTGATQLKRGKIEIANGGTVFLDEVGDISEELQAKLLRFLQEREFERVGGTLLIRVDVRIIAATTATSKPQQRRAVSRGFVLPHQRCSYRAPSFERAKGRCVGFGAVLYATLFHGVKKELHRDFPGGVGSTQCLRLAGKRARAGERYRKSRSSRPTANYSSRRSISRDCLSGGGKQ